MQFSLLSLLIVITGVALAIVFHANLPGMIHSLWYAGWCLGGAFLAVVCRDERDERRVSGWGAAAAYAVATWVWVAPRSGELSLFGMTLAPLVVWLAWVLSPSWSRDESRTSP